MRPNEQVVYYDVTPGNWNTQASALDMSVEEICLAIGGFDSVYDAAMEGLANTGTPVEV